MCYACIGTDEAIGGAGLETALLVFSFSMSFSAIVLAYLRRLTSS